MNPVLNPRQTMAHLPSILQHPLTWITGKPLSGQQPLFRWIPRTRLLAGMTATLLGSAASLLALAHGGVTFLLLLPGFLLTSGGLRALYLEIAHNAVHHAFGKSRRVDRLITEIFTTLTLMNGYHVFRREHVQKHHGKNGTLEDPDYAALVAWGFAPGLPFSLLLRRAMLAPINPRIHASYLLARLRTNFIDGPRSRRALALAWHGGMLAAVAATGTWLAFLVVWALPLIWGFQVSSLLQMLAGEHRWGLDVPSGRDGAQLRTYGRFVGDFYPANGVSAKLRWWARLAFLHLPARVFVFVGNDIGPAHDVHHRRPFFDWSNAAYAREAMIARGELGGAVDVWGSLPEMVVYAMRGLSAAPGVGARDRQAA